jgi:hypothetical protein
MIALKLLVFYIIPTAAAIILALYYTRPKNGSNDETE